MSERLFGTDGVRGVAGEFPLDEPTVFQLGKSLATILRRETGQAPRVIIGRDTRESGRWLERALAAGFAAEGGEVEAAGVATTPAVAFFTRQFNFDAGVVISASHNPFTDNGIKIFVPSGRKLEDRFEQEIEQELLARPQTRPSAAYQIKPATQFNEAYLNYLITEIGAGLDLQGLRVVVDCSNGAASTVGPAVLRQLGAEVTTVGTEPDGRNINEGCGSLHPAALQAAVERQGASLGIAFDGDADRAMFVDEAGTVRDGDYVLFIIGRHWQARGELAGNTVVATVMSNIGLELALAELGLQLTRTSVGDKYVLEELLRTDGTLGGEQSGHIIFPRLSLAGDGLITALQLLRVIQAEGQSLRELAAGMQQYPQVLLNVPVGRKPPLDSIPEIREASAALERALAGRGRLLLRYSGTENLARVMIEGQDQAEINQQAEALAAVIQQALG